MSKGGFMKDAMILCAITLVAGACLGGVYGVTKEPIEQANLAAKAAAYQAVLPEASVFESGNLAGLMESANAEIAGLGYGNVTVDEAVMAMDSSGASVGYVVTSTSNDGYGGAITVSVGIQADGTVSGIEFLTITETAGLGMNAQKPEWKAQYSGKNVDAFAVTKNGASSDNEINAISGATITSEAVTDAVNAAVYFAKNCITQ
ncbi:MAG: RnfABCDGE type electron transport complex subunit G [Lachnospiraceae bacterium]|jgi:electron transport complex protein RnfG|nr:RnfABCDGE type electron transport complex subunit G [Lachnospiraceae bacterium]